MRHPTTGRQAVVAAEITRKDVVKRARHDETGHVEVNLFMPTIIRDFGAPIGILR